MLSRRRMLTIALGGAATVALPAPAWAVDDQRPGAATLPALTGGDRLVARQVSAERALEHLRVLSVGIGPRIGGTRSEKVAADYIAKTLDRLGYDVTLQPFGVADKFLAQLSSTRGLPLATRKRASVRVSLVRRSASTSLNVTSSSSGRASSRP